MLFKGTTQRSAFDIAAAIDSVGGVLNASTGKELTSFYVKVPDYHLPLAIELLADILRNALFDPLEMEKEKSVVLQEIRLMEDTPDDFIHEFFSSVFWNGHPLGRPVLGTGETVSGFQRDVLLDFFQERYRGDRLVLTAAGNLKHEELLTLVSRAFGSMAISADEAPPEIAPVPQSAIGLLDKDLEQVHLLMGSVSHPFSSPTRYAAFLMNTVLGGSMSSRLFQEIREKRGLAYSVHSYVASYRDTGLFGIYAGTSAENVREILDVVSTECHRLKTEVLTDLELFAAKEQIKGHLLLSMESTDHRMTRLAKNEIYLHRHLPPEETVANIEEVTKENIQELACDLFKRETTSIAALGKVTGEVIHRDMLRF